MSLQPFGAEPELVLGPLLRYAGTESATFWVETSAPCEVEILGHRIRTFTVEGHHYALLLVDDLEPGTVTPYDVRLDGDARVAARRRPAAPGRPHARPRAPRPARLRLVPASAARSRRASTASGPRPSERGIDALWTYSKLLQRGEAEWPDGLLLLGDQVYADEVSPATLEFIRARRDTSEPARRGDRRLRGVHAPLPRVVVRAGHPLAALDGADGDDLRRPRRQRRLEHLLELGRGDAAPAVVGGARDRRLHGVLDLPAHRQPLAARARRRARRSTWSPARTTPGRSSGASRTSGTASRRRAAGPTTATSATPACSCSTPGRRACSPRAAATWSTRRSGSGSSSTRAARSTTS